MGSARPRKRYSHALKSTGVIDLTVMKVSSGAYFMTSMPAYRRAKKVMTSGVKIPAILQVKGSTSTMPV